MSYDERIASVGAAISIMEGMHCVPSARAKTLCWVNNNPGNISVHANKKYPTLQAGWKGVFDLLTAYRERFHYTLEEAIGHWAPPSDGNNTAVYLQFVEDYTGIKRTEKL